MKVTSIIGNQCIRLFRPSEEAPDSVKALHIIRAFEARYGFYQGPRVLADYNLTTGITFLHGQFRRSWFIDKFQLFNNGVLVEAKVSTDDLDAFLDDSREWARNEMGLLGSSDENIVGRSYLSQIEVQADISLSNTFAQFNALGREIGDAIRSYGQNALPFEVVGVSLLGDLANVPAPKPGAAFIFARREGQPFNSGIYYASAPLRSADHLRFLNQLEQMFLAMTRA